MNCTNCGTHLADDALFCFSCGAKVNSQPAVAPAVMPAVETTPVAEATPVVEEAPVAEETVEEEK